MTVPTSTLLRQLAGEVEWFTRTAIHAPMNWALDPLEGWTDHRESALDIIDEIDGRQALLNGHNWITGHVIAMADLRRLHDLIKGAASREAMDLIRRMMGGDTGGDNV